MISYVLLMVSSPESWLVFPDQTSWGYSKHPIKIDKDSSGEVELVRTCILLILTDCKTLLEMVKVCAGHQKAYVILPLQLSGWIQWVDHLYPQFSHLLNDCKKYNLCRWKYWLDNRTWYKYHKSRHCHLNNNLLFQFTERLIKPRVFYMTV